MFAGAGREVLWDTTQANYSNTNSLSDPSRNRRTPFAICHETLFDLLDGGITSQLVTVQMHSYDTQAHTGLRDVQVSAFADDSKPNPPLRDRAEHLDLVHYMGQFPVQGLSGYPEITRSIEQYISLWSSPQYYFYTGSDSIAILSSGDLIGAGINQQGQYSHRVHNTDVDPENFIHVEIDEYPDGLWSPTRWQDWLPGNMPATMQTYALALEYYDPLIRALDSAIHHSIYPDFIPPVTVQLLQAVHIAADTVYLRWIPPAIDRFFDTYLLYYDTVEISGASPCLTRLNSGLSSLVDFRTTFITARGFPQPVSRYRFAIGSRDIWGNYAVRSNSLMLTGGTVAYRLSDTYIGCGAGCREDTLYLTFSETGYVVGQLFVVLPAQLEVTWPAGNQNQNVMPSANVATNLQFSTARRVGSSTSDTIEVNVQWRPPYSDGNATRNIASIPFRNQSATTTGPLAITARDTSVFYDSSGMAHVNSFFVGPITVYNDCSAPSTSISYRTPAPTCAFGTSSASQGRISVSVLRGSTPNNSQLSLAYVEVNANASQRIVLFNILQSGNYSNSSFPSASDAVTMWNYLNSGCNNLVVHSFDHECNEGISTTLVVVKDISPPGLIVVNSDTAFCYNNTVGSANYGGSLLDNFLDVTTSLGAGSCAAGTGTLTISYGVNNWIPINLPPDLAGYPNTDSEALPLWTWIVSQVPITANGELHTFMLQARDCATNTASDSFAIHIDLTSPANTLTQFDARPTDMGIWLKWEWTYSSSQATSMEVWRSAFIADYPSYTIDRWSDLSNPAYYPIAYPPANFVRVAQQNGMASTASGEYNIANGQGHIVFGGPENSYWLDQDSSWNDESEDRGIYRYVTFIKDAGGNLSTVAGYSLNMNADRSTNYWLGDYTRDVTPDPNGSSGIVSTADLSLLSAIYFTSVPPTASLYDIGPENSENDLGKGIPSPDGQIDFFDLVPFSANFGATGPNSFHVNSPHRRPTFNLDAQPLAAIRRVNQNLIGTGDEFEILVSLSGNSDHRVKVVQSTLHYDMDILDAISVSSNTVETLDGVSFVVARLIEGESGRIGIAAAALGELAGISGDCDLATMTFLWKSEHAAVTQIELRETRFADGTGHMIQGVSSKITVTVENAIPSVYALYQNYPNPFNSATQIQLDLPQASPVELTIFNSLGQEVVTLIERTLPAGVHRLSWNAQDAAGTNVSSGIYFIHVKASNFSAIKKMALIR
jgi:hypothetical protein